MSSAHRQVAGTVAIEISNHCNANCPICLGDNQATFEMSAGEIQRLVQAAIQDQRNIGVLTLSGGEPTIHPQFFETFDTTRLSKCSCQHLLPGRRRVPSCGYYACHRQLDPRFGASTGRYWVAIPARTGGVCKGSGHCVWRPYRTEEVCGGRAAGAGKAEGRNRTQKSRYFAVRDAWSVVGDFIL